MNIQGPSYIPKVPLGVIPPQKSQKDAQDQKASPTVGGVEKKSDAPAEAKFNLSAATEFLDSSKQGIQDQLMAKLLVSQSPEVTGNKASLEQFLAYKLSPDPVQRSLAVGMLPSEVGIKEWLIGMVGMLYDPGNQDPGLLQSIIRNVLAFVTSDQELFLLAPALKAIVSRLGDLPDSFIQQVVKTVQNSALMDTTNPGTRAEISAFLDTLSIQGLGQAGVPSEGKGAMISLTDLTTNRLATLLLQARATTMFVNEDGIKGHWLALYSAFLGIETSLSLLEDELDPYIPDEVALLVDSSTHLPERFNILAIQTLDSQHGHIPDLVKERIQFLFQRKFKRIFALMPNPTFATVYQMVSQTVEALPQKVRIFDLKTFGPGLADLVEMIAEGLYLSGVKHNAEGLITQAISRYRYWVAPQYSVVARQPWFKKLPKKRPLRANLLPVLALFDEPCAVQALSTTDETVSFLFDRVSSAFAMGYPYRKIIVGYRSNFRSAVELVHMLEDSFSVDVEMRHAEPGVIEWWGDHLSLSIV